jgi:chromate reductase, NAD(P)H dehydrogenase (quinone)
MTMSIHILGISGSLRRASYNSALLRAANELLPENVTLEISPLDGIPLFNQDTEADVPETVRIFRESIASADAVLFATPEYNASIPGVLKNAIDWASRPPERVLDGKPAAIMGATTGQFGTLRAQLHLRQILSHVNMQMVNKPEVYVMQAKSKFDANGRLTDETSRGFVRDLVVNLVQFAQRLNVK